MCKMTAAITVAFTEAKILRLVLRDGRCSISVACAKASLLEAIFVELVLLFNIYLSLNADLNFFGAVEV